MNIIDKALKEGRTTLSEYESKRLLAKYKIPITKEKLVDNTKDLNTAIDAIGFPMVLKGCSPDITHKTEKGLIRVDIRNKKEAQAAFQDIRKNMGGKDKTVLVQQMVKGQRELVVGMTRDPQFGPCVMFGLGGIFTEILKDISFRVAPLEKRDAMEMMQDIKGHKILDAVRGMKAANLEKMCKILLNVGTIGLEHDAIKEIDINPLILSGSNPVAVDALVVLEKPE
ncbi:acetate--CoA ligase family protein [Thermodesulfobacteriota bacterium]